MTPPPPKKKSLGFFFFSLRQWVEVAGEKDSGGKLLFSEGGPCALRMDLLKPLWLVYAKRNAGMRGRRDDQARTSPLCARHIHPHLALHTLMPSSFFFFNHKMPSEIQTPPTHPSTHTHTHLLPSAFSSPLSLFFYFCHAKIIRFM